jgi:hypothetical protein
VRAITLSSLFIAAALGCSATSSSEFTAGAGGAGASGQGGTGAGMSGSSGIGGGFTTAGSGSSASGGSPGCSLAAELVYVFSLQNDIYSFDPPSKKFTKVATPDCQAGGQPNSMAIDRNLVAWLNYIGGIYTFDLNKKSGCKLAISPPAGFAQVGMGFSTDMVGGTAETLYLDGIGGGGLAKVNMATMTVVKIGLFSNDPKLTGQSAELTGTGDARLFGYFTTFPYVRVAQLDKGNANIISDNELTGVTPPSAWAFSFWGGDFYLYAAPGANATGNSSVIHYSPSNNMVDPTYVADVGFEIIGAGVSTCAPTKPPS